MVGSEPGVGVVRVTGVVSDLGCVFLISVVFSTDFCGGVAVEDGVTVASGALLPQPNIRRDSKGMIRIHNRGERRAFFNIHILIRNHQYL
jgi:hypothetical protein